MEDTPSSDRPQPAPGRRPRDLVVSLLVLLVPLLVLVGGYQVLAGRGQPVPVDQGSQIAAARQAGVEVSEPAGLDAAWVPVSAAFRADDGGATLRLGYLTPAGEPVQLVQSTVPVAQLLATELTNEPAPDGVVDVDGAPWQRYPGRSGETALVRHEPGRTLLVVGPTAVPELRELASSLN